MLTRRGVFQWLPAALVALLVVGAAAAWGSLPDPMATHFDQGGLPDGMMPRLGGLVVAPLIALAAALGLAAAGRRVNDAWAIAGFGYLLLGFMWAVQLGLIASNRGAETAGDARLAGLGWMTLSVVFAAFGVWAARRCTRAEPLDASVSYARVDVSLEDGGETVAVTLRGLDVLWALRRHVRVPRRAVLRAQVLDRSKVKPSGLRLPGTELPGVLRAGSFGRSPNREFWDVRSGPQVLVLTLADGQPYRRIVLQPRDPGSALDALQLSPA